MTTDTCGRGRLGVVLLNLGGPETLRDIRPFLRSLLSDPEVLYLPGPLRRRLAERIATRRAPRVAESYRMIGSGSPIGRLTRDQVTALQEQLGPDFLVRHIFRHSRPRSDEVLAELARRGVRRVIALPAYPQWSLSTTGSAMRNLSASAQVRGMQVREVLPYPTAKGFVEALCDAASRQLGGVQHVLLSAHGLPEIAISRRKDPYLRHVRATAAAISTRLGNALPRTLVFQSRFGPLRWTQPALIDVLQRLGRSGVTSVMIVPISFICENLETKYELDIEVTEIAREAGIREVVRVPVPGTDPRFIRQLSGLVEETARLASWRLDNGC